MHIYRNVSYHLNLRQIVDMLLQKILGARAIKYIRRHYEYYTAGLEERRAPIDQREDETVVPK